MMAWDRPVPWDGSLPSPVRRPGRLLRALGLPLPTSQPSPGSAQSRSRRKPGPFPGPSSPRRRPAASPRSLLTMPFALGTPAISRMLTVPSRPRDASLPRPVGRLLARGEPPGPERSPAGARGPGSAASVCAPLPAHLPRLLAHSWPHSGSPRPFLQDVPGALRGFASVSEEKTFGRRSGTSAGSSY